jgi:hypothetical protein
MPLASQLQEAISESFVARHNQMMPEDLNRRFEETLVEFQLFGRTKGDLRGAKKGQTITYKSKEGGEKKLTVVSIGRHKGFGKMVVAKDQKGSQYHLPLNDEGQATVVLRKTGDPKDPNETMADLHAMPKAWLSENLDEAAGELGKPDVITGMKYGGTRYKYLHGVNIDHVEKDKEFIVWQADYPKSKRLGTAKTLKDAEKLALQKADLSQRRGE